MTSLPKIFGERRLGPILAGAGLAVLQAGCAGVSAFATRDIFAALYAGSAAAPLVSLAALGSVLTRLGGLDGTVAPGGQNLSAGEARRVHLARTVLAQPRLLLLDEPDDNLDEDGRAVLAKVLQESRATTLVVTHDMGLARRADVVWSIEAGVLKSRGHPEAVLRPSVTAA